MHSNSTNIPVEASTESLCSFDPNDAMGEGAQVFADAARGDLTAQRRLRNGVIRDIETVDASAPHALLHGIELVQYARLCAAHGSDEDARRLAGALCYTFEASRFAGYGNRAECLAGEAVCILERLAEGGDDASSLAAVEIVNLHPPAGDIARRLMKGER